MRTAIKKSLAIYKQAIPIMLSVFLLINLLNPFVSSYYPVLFSGNIFIDPLIGALLGSVSFGIPITSYIIGGELLRVGVSLLAVSAFIMTWTTVGVVMLPLEAKYLGVRFAVVRNSLNFVFSIIIAVLAVAILNFI